MKLFPFKLVDAFHFRSCISSNSLPSTSIQCGKLVEFFTKSKSMELGRKLHAFSVVSGLLVANTYLSTKFCAMYAICGSMTDARALFDAIAFKNSFLWNVMIRGYACAGLSIDSIVLYRRMLEFGRNPDNFAFPFVLMACGDAVIVDVGRIVHGEVVVGGFESNVYVGNSLVSMYCKFGEIEIARKVFDRMIERDLTSWNTMISGYVRNNEPLRALLLFANKVTLSDEGVDRVTLLSVLPACSELMALRQGKEIHAYVLRRKDMDFDGFLSNALLDVYVNSKFVSGAKRLFERMSRKDVVSWNSIISGYVRHGNVFGSLRLFREMNRECVFPDSVTLLAILSACEQFSSLQLGRTLHAFMTKKGYNNNTIMGTALIDMYAKCGSLPCAHHVFDEIPIKNLISWSAMISAYGFHGMGREAIACFDEMKNQGIKPDEVIFTSILSACSHSGLVEEGKHTFQQMQEQYHMKPAAGHYSSMIDLLGRAGLLGEAYEMVSNTDIGPNTDVWQALLSASCLHQNVKLVEIAAAKIIDLQPTNVGPYVSLSAMYAMEKRWSDVERIKATARSNGVKKLPGFSSLELVHEQIVHDNSHSQYQHIGNL